MHPRRSDDEQLFTMILFGDNDRPRWYRDLKIKRYLEYKGYDFSCPHTTALKLVRQLQTNPQRYPDNQYWQRALCCYLQESLWQVAQKLTHTRFSSVYNQQDFFQTACDILMSDLPKTLSKFDPQKCNLSGFCYMRLYDRVYGVCHGARQSNWGLLRSASQKQLREALAYSGYSQSESTLILFLVKCWQDLTTGSTAPDVHTLDQLSRTYRQCHPQSPPLTADDIEEYLNVAIQALRRYNSPEVVHFPKPEELEQVACSLPTPQEALLTEEQQAQLQQLNSILRSTLAAALSNLNDTSRRIVCLHYCEHVSQTVIAKQLGLSQSKVSHTLTKMRASLVRALLDGFGQQYPDRASLKEMGALVHLWLQEYYGSFPNQHPPSSCCQFAPLRSQEASR